MSENESAELTAERPCSCELSVNAKKEIAYKVKSYGATLNEAINDAFAGKNRVEAMLQKTEAPPSDGAN